jgi:Flagellar hook-length control protein FliK
MIRSPEIVDLLGLLPASAPLTEGLGSPASADAFLNLMTIKLDAPLQEPPSKDFSAEPAEEAMISTSAFYPIDTFSLPAEILGDQTSERPLRQLALSDEHSGWTALRDDQVSGLASGRAEINAPQSDVPQDVRAPQNAFLGPTQPDGRTNTEAAPEISPARAVKVTASAVAPVERTSETPAISAVRSPNSSQWAPEIVPFTPLPGARLSSTEATTQHDSSLARVGKEANSTDSLSRDLRPSLNEQAVTVSSSRHRIDVTQTQFAVVETELSNGPANSPSAQLPTALPTPTVTPASTPVSAPNSTPTPAVPVATPAQLPEILSESIGRDEERRDRVVIQLDPPELGRVSLEFKFDAAGLQTVTITAETSEAAKRLRAMHSDLVLALEQQGLSGDNLSFSQQQSREQPPRLPGYVSIESSEDSPGAASPRLNTSATAINPVPTIGLDIRV